MVQEKLGK